MTDKEDTPAAEPKKTAKGKDMGLYSFVSGVSDYCFQVFQADLREDRRATPVARAPHILFDPRKSIAVAFMPHGLNVLASKGGYPIPSHNSLDVVCEDVLAMRDLEQSIGKRAPRTINAALQKPPSIADTVDMRETVDVVEVGEPIFITGLQSGAIIVRLDARATDTQIARASVIRSYVSSEAGIAWADGWLFRSTRKSAEDEE